MVLEEDPFGSSCNMLSSPVAYDVWVATFPSSELGGDENHNGEENPPFISTIEERLVNHILKREVNRILKRKVRLFLF